MKEYIKKILSSDPLASYSRFASFLAMLVFLVLDIHSCIKASGVVNGLTRDVLIGQGFFVNAIYGCGKVGETVQKFSDKQ